jgi:hypothetical protein
VQLQADGAGDDPPLSVLPIAHGDVLVQPTRLIPSRLSAARLAPSLCASTAAPSRTVQSSLIYTPTQFNTA